MVKLMLFVLNFFDALAPPPAPEHLLERKKGALLRARVFFLFWLGIDFFLNVFHAFLEL